LNEENETIPELQKCKIKIEQSELFIKTLKEELTNSKLEKNRADATISELTKKIAELSIHHLQIENNNK
jgi:hypothetical protein